MHKAMIVALAALATLLLMPLPGFARDSQYQGIQRQGSYSQHSTSPGSFQRGIQPRGSFAQRGFTRYGGYRGVYQQGGYRGVYPYSGYRSGYRYGGYPYRGYRYGGYRYGGYPYWGYRYGGYPYYGSNVYFSSGGIWLGPGWGIGWPYYYPYSYPYSYPYYSTPPVVVEQPPTEYIERDQEPEESNYWYHCSDPEGYYPTVQCCPSGWSKEIPSSLPPDQ